MHTYFNFTSTSHVIVYLIVQVCMATLLTTSHQQTQSRYLVGYDIHGLTTPPAPPPSTPSISPLGAGPWCPSVNRYVHSHILHRGMSPPPPVIVRPQATSCLLTTSCLLSIDISYGDLSFVSFVQIELLQLNVIFHNLDYLTAILGRKFR